MTPSLDTSSSRVSVAKNTPGDDFSIREKRDTGQIGHANQKTALFTFTLPGPVPAGSKWPIIGTEIGLAVPPHTGSPKMRATKCLVGTLTELGHRDTWGGG